MENYQRNVNWIFGIGLAVFVIGSIILIYG